MAASTRVAIPADFQSGDQILAAARQLRDYALAHVPGDGDDPFGILIVEGDGDFKVFAPLCYHKSLVLPVKGKGRVLEAYDAKSSDGDDAFVFVIDRDAGVGGERLGKVDLIVTEHADVECDLVAMGALEDVAMEFVRSVSGGDDPAEVAEAIYTRAIAIAEPIGRVRRAAHRAGVSLKMRPRERYSLVLDVANTDQGQVLDVALQQLRLRTNFGRPQELKIMRYLPSTPTGFDTCNGHDLVIAVQIALTTDFGVDGAVARGVETALRMTLRDPGRREGWSVISGLRKWEEVHRRQLLKP